MTRDATDAWDRFENDSDLSLARYKPRKTQPPAIVGHRPNRFDAGARRCPIYLRHMSSGVKDLKVWQEAVALAGDVVRAARQNTRRETKAFTDHLMLTASAVAVGIATGYVALAADDQRRAYDGARRVLLELETRLAIARHAGLIPAATNSQLTGRITTVSRLLTGYVSFLERQADRPRPSTDEATALT